jgi:hypothetical protein
MSAAGTQDRTRPEFTIEISVGKPQQLFNSLDPSPFHDRDLDPAAVEYIFGGAEEIALPRPIKLVIHLPQDQHAEQLESAIHNHFARQQRQNQRQLRLLFRDGRIALSVGLTFLLVCMLIRQLSYSFGSGAISEIVAEGMLIAGWVAMWRPLEIFLYEWWPIRRRTRVLGKLAAMPVIVRTQ